MDARGDVLLNGNRVALEALADALRSALGGAATGRDTRVVVAVDRAAPSGTVVQAMLKAREGGAEHFILAVAPK